SNAPYMPTQPPPTISTRRPPGFIRLSRGREGAERPELLGIGRHRPQPYGVVARPVAVRPAGDHQAEPLGQAPVVLALLRGVVAVVGLQARHPRPGHGLDEILGYRGLCPPHARVGEHARAARPADEPERVEWIEGVLGNVRRPVVADQAV